MICDVFDGRDLIGRVLLRQDGTLETCPCFPRAPFRILCGPVCGQCGHQTSPITIIIHNRVVVFVILCWTVSHHLISLILTSALRLDLPSRDKD
jgi:hypothetical protein